MRLPFILSFLFCGLLLPLASYGQTDGCQAYSQLLRKAKTLERYQERLLFLEEKIVKREGDTLCTAFADVLHAYARVCNGMGKYWRALQIIDRCLAIREQLPQSVEEQIRIADALRSKAVMFARLDDQEASSKYLLQAEKIVQPLIYGPDSVRATAVYSEILDDKAVIAMGVADYELGLLILDRILAFPKELRSDFATISAPISRAQLQIANGAEREGIKAVGSYLDTTDLTDWPDFYGFALSLYGEGALRTKDYETAYDYLSCAREEFQRQCADSKGKFYPCTGAGSVGVHLLEYYLATGQTRYAETFFCELEHEADALALEDAYHYGNLYLQGARIAGQHNDQALAESRFQQSLNYLVRKATVDGPARLPVLSGNVVYRNELLMDWLLHKFSYYAKHPNPVLQPLALDCHFKLDSLLYNLNQRGSLTAALFNALPKFRDHYEGAIRLTRRLGRHRRQPRKYVAATFRIIAATKGNALRRRLDGAQIAELAGIPPAELELRERLRTDLVIAQADEKAAAPVYRPERQDEVLKLANRLAAFDDRLAFGYPLFAAALARPPLPTITELPSLVHPHQAVIDFYHGRQTLYATVTDLTRGITYYETALPDTFSSLINTYLDYPAASQALYQLLLGQLIAELPRDVTRLAFIPDGALWAVAFASLKNDDRYLIQDFALSTAYSWQSLRSVQSTSGQVSLPYAGFGVDFAADADFVISDEQTSLLTGPRGFRYNPLPFAVEEVRTGAQITGGQVYANAEVTKENFFCAFAEHAVVHIATHGIVDEINPYASAIVLAPRCAGEETCGELVSLAEILQQSSFRIPLVILNACHTDNGGVANGEGINSLARAFCFGGTRSVLAQRWEVADKAGFDISTGFLEALNKGEAVDHALQTSTINYLDRWVGTKFESPRLWASPVLLGYADKRHNFKVATEDPG
jgi:CHAT domain-containing protein